jgi:hypothetical protein
VHGAGLPFAIDCSVNYTSANNYLLIFVFCHLFTSLYILGVAMATNAHISLPVRKRPRGRPFAKGNGGRKVGSRNRATLLADALPEGEQEELVRKGIELAKAGDTQMLKFFLDRILPKERLVKIDLPTIEHHRDLTTAYAAIVQAVARGEVAPGEGSAVAALLANIARFIDDAEVETRLRSLETQLNYLQAKS